MLIEDNEQLLDNFRVQVLILINKFIQIIDTGSFKTGYFLCKRSISFDS